MEKTRILWSGITGRTGICAQEASKDCNFAEICAGVCRVDQRFYHYDELDKIKPDFDVIVDFSHKDCFDKILAFAIKTKKPLVCGTSGLTAGQLLALNEKANIIPIFRGGNFRFEVKKFIDKVIKFAKDGNSPIKLVETHYKSKKIPSETAKVIAQKVFIASGKTVEIDSRLEYDDLINDWKVGNLHCRVCGFEGLARDILQIAHMLAGTKPNGLYDLDRLWAESNKV